jgi:translation initiation factor 2 beta subunit (eIF-2beta)/eIF-5
MSININNSINDPSYRYKMDKINISQTGRGGNSHTVLNNLDKICMQINTAPNILLNYIGSVLGSNTNNNLNNIKGHYTAETIQEIIYIFIKFAVLCNKCNIPELTPEISKDAKNNKKNILIIKCSACGKNYELIGNNKHNDKLVDNMIKYYIINPFVAKKGLMVTDINNLQNNDFNQLI